MSNTEAKWVLDKIEAIQAMLKMDKEDYIKHCEEKFGMKLSEDTVYASKTGEAAGMLSSLAIHIEVAHDLA